MDLQQKRAALIEYFKDKLRLETDELKEADDSQKELVEEEMEKTLFSLSLLEDGRTVYNGETIDLTEAKIEMMAKAYLQAGS